MAEKTKVVQEFVTNSLQANMKLAEEMSAMSKSLESGDLLDVPRTNLRVKQFGQRVALCGQAVRAGVQLEL